MGISTQVFNKFHLYEPAARCGFWAIQVNVILCEKRRGERGKKREKEREKKKRKRREEESKNEAC
jgi:hypothetical protein